MAIIRFYTKKIAKFGKEVQFKAESWEELKRKIARKLKIDYNNFDEEFIVFYNSINIKLLELTNLNPAEGDLILVFDKKGDKKCLESGQPS